MGVYLSTPITDKESEEGEHGFLKYGASSMQGWRKGMEDAHLALGELPGGVTSKEGEGISMFAVFDGHGGAEVARFTAAHLPNEIQRIPEFQEGNYSDALVKAFHRVDQMLEEGKPEYKEQLTEFRAMGEAAAKAQSANRSGGGGGGGPGGGNDSDGDGDKPAGALSAQEALEIFQKLLAISNGGKPGAGGGAGGGEEDSDDDEGGEEEGKAAAADEAKAGTEAVPGDSAFPPLGAAAAAAPEAAAAAAAAPPADVQLSEAQRKQVCELPDHELQAGCTSVVVLVVGRRLFVANAGDSRAVLCRAGGTAYALSHDHKPSQEVETARIHRAGGFVTPAGRVNGNLNLSRSLGDLKYKQNKALPPRDQMITAEPDVTCTELQPDDEFIIIGCDGIWDCKTNQEAVDFVRERLVRGMPCAKICEEMMDDCLAEDPRKTTGIGGDNMTCVVVQLQQPS